MLWMHARGAGAAGRALHTSRPAQPGPSGRPPSAGDGASVARQVGSRPCGPLALGRIRSQHVCQHGMGATLG